MTRARVLLLLPLLAAATLVTTAACCSRLTDSPACATPPAPGPTGTVWPDGWTFRATRITEDGAQKQLAAGTVLTIVVEYAYHLHAYAGCDQIFVDGSAKDGGFFLTKVDSIPPTAHPCRDDLVAQDNWIRGFFADNPQWTRNGDDLTLRTNHVEIDLVTEPLPTFTDSCGFTLACATVTRR